MSTTKSVAGVLVRMLDADEKLALDDKVSRFIPEWRAGAEQGVTVRHLPSMTSKLPRLQQDGVGSVSDKESLVFELPLAHAPGTNWDDSNEGVFFVSPLMDRAAGEPIEDYAQPRLFEPLGLRRTRLHIGPKCEAWTHADVETAPRDLARIGLPMLERGRSGGRLIMPESWVPASTRPSQDLRSDCGLLWWLRRRRVGFAALGRFDTNLDVFPDPE